MGNLLVLKDVDFSDVAVAKADGILWYGNYDSSSVRTNTFSMRTSGLNIIGLNQSSLNGKKVVGVKLLITSNSYTASVPFYIYKFNGSEQVAIGSFSSNDCDGKTEIAITCDETLFDDNSWLGVGSLSLTANAITSPFCGVYSGGTTKQIGDKIFGDSVYIINCEIFVKDE